MYTFYYHYLWHHVNYPRAEQTYLHIFLTFFKKISKFLAKSPRVPHKGSMNFTRYYYGIKRMPILLCLFVAVFTDLSAQSHGQQSFFDRLTDERFIFDRLNEDDTDEESEIEMNENSESETVREYVSDETSESEQKTNSTKSETVKDAEQQPDESAKSQTDKADPASNIQPNDTSASKETASERDYFFRYMHSIRKGAQTSVGISGRGYIGYLQLEAPMPIPYFELSIRNFGIGLYPLAALQSYFPEKNIPTLFLGAGGLTFDGFLKAANFTGYAKTKASYGGLKFPREQFIGIGGAQKTVHYGVEVYGSGWNGAVFASPEPKKQRMRYGFMGGWRMSRKKTNINFTLQHLTAFMPELTGEVKTTAARTANGKTSSIQPSGTSGIYNEYTQQHYHALFGLNAVFTHPIVSFAATGFTSYAANKIVSGALQAECDVRHRYAGIRTGGSYTGANAVNWDGNRQNEQITAFIQPYVKAGIFSVVTLYAFDREDGTLLHNGGVTAQVKHNVIRWKANWDYRNELHTAKTELICVSNPKWFSGVQWFQKAVFGVSADLQDKTANPFVLKKYAAYVNSSFCIADSVFCGIGGSVSQSIRKEENKRKRLIYLKNPVYGGSVYVSVKRNGIGKTHSGKLELSVKNENPYFDIKLGYQVRGK